MYTRQRVRDPVHNIIEFSGTEFDDALWHVVETRAFQRLRRVKQLGFSDFVYPGASHTRFAHSLDFEWLIANIEVGSVPAGVDESPLGNLDTFVLGPKAVYAAEAYVLGLFQLYPTVYFHKATRSAEKTFRTPGGELVDLGERSRVVRAIEPFRLFRVYCSDSDQSAREFIESAINGETANG